MYSIYDYGTMIADSGRMDAYVQAVKQAVKPGDVVLDIGTGTGIFALIAAQLGAKQVYAIETNSAIAVAQQVATINGYGDKIQFIQDLSTKITLPEPADVIISDLRGVVPLHCHHIPSIIDARTRLLAPDGVLIPQQDTIWAAIVNAPELHRGYVAPWNERPYGFKMESVLSWSTNTWSKARVTPKQLITEPQVWTVLNYQTITDVNVAATLEWSVTEASMAHGIALWFDAVIAEGISFSNAPGKPDIIYGQAFFPWSNAVELVAGDRIQVTIKANLVNEDYIWNWHTKIFDVNSPQNLKANFKQSTFLGNPLPPSLLRKQGDDYLPMINQEGKFVQTVLQLMMENKTLGEIADNLVVSFPDCFNNQKEALNKVVEISQMYSN